LQQSADRHATTHAHIILTPI